MEANTSQTVASEDVEEKSFVLHETKDQYLIKVFDNNITFHRTAIRGAQRGKNLSVQIHLARIYTFSLQAMTVRLEDGGKTVI